MGGPNGRLNILLEKLAAATKRPDIRAKLVIVDADYGAKKGDWDTDPWSRTQFDHAVRVRQRFAVCLLL